MLEMSAITKPKMFLAASSFIVLCARIQPKITYAELEGGRCGEGGGEGGGGVWGRGRESGEDMEEGTIKTQNPKCRLYWRLIEYIDWRYNQSCWYFPPLV
jgi:hypothetical protein